MKYRIPIRQIFKQHTAAWYAIVGDKSNSMTWEDIDKDYDVAYHAKLIRRDDDIQNGYEFAEFDSKKRFVLFMLEWS